jgi:multiple sugar transport system permease protein
MTSATRGRQIGLGGWSGRTIVALVLAIFVLFFAIPIVWLLLATTKSARGLIVRHPFAPGGLGDLRANWHQLFAFQDGAVTTWVANSALYAVGALAITLVAGMTAGGTKE